MARVNASVYNMLRPIDMAGSFQKGLGVRDQIDQQARRQQEQAWQDETQKAYGLGIQTNPDGTTTFDQNKFQTALGTYASQGNPYAAKALGDVSNSIYERKTLSEKAAEDKRRWEEENRRGWAQVNATKANNNFARQERNDQKIDADVQKLSKEIAGVQDMTNALDEVEGQLGFSLDQAKTDSGNLTVNGRPVDLPGVSIPLLGRVSGYNDKAQRLQSSAAKVFNTVLKDRSGAAVSNSELERLKTEFGEGKYNTEAQMIDALQRYKRGVNLEMRNREAGFSPEVVQRYSEQGGRTSKSQLRARPSDPITKDYNSMDDDALAKAYYGAGGQ